MHDWSEENFDWAGINEAARYIGVNLRKWGRVGVRDYKEKYGCYDQETEVLTDHGWLPFYQIDKDFHKIATRSSGGVIEYQSPSEVIFAPYQGEMLRLNTRGADLLVTPNHNLFFATPDIHGGKDDSGFTQFPARLARADSEFRKPKKLFKGGVWFGDSPEFITIPDYSSSWSNVPNSNRRFYAPMLSVDADALLELMGWYTAEGYGISAEACLSLDGTDNDEELEQVVALVDRCQFPYTVRRRASSTIVSIQSIQIAKFLQDQCGHLAMNKKCPKFVKALSPKKIERYLTGLYAGDGHKAKTSHILTTISKRLADDVMELLLKAGYCSNLDVRDRRGTRGHCINGHEVISRHICYEINWLNKNEHRTFNSHDTQDQIATKESWVEYQGMVGCVTVPNHVIYVRRNGKPVWCGNSVRVYNDFGITMIHSLIWPGWAYNQYKYKWMWKLDCSYGRFITWPLNLVAVPCQQWLYRYLYKRAVAKYPHLRKEIVSAADWPELIKNI